jgi:hypothetical protein
VIFFSLSFAAVASEVADLKIFTHDTPAMAEDVNHNFSEVKKAVKDNFEQISDKVSVNGGTMTGPLTVPSITYEPAKQGSVTYSAMGFTPGTNISFPWYTKNNNDGSLAASATAAEPCTFYHSLMLRAGVTITGIQATADDKVIVKLKQEKSAVTLAEIPSSDGINHTLESATGYYIEVVLSNTDQKFYSVTIEYTYTEP